MTANQAVAKARRAYTTGTGIPSENGDTLLQFVLNEIAETFPEDASPQAQRAEVVRVVDQAISDLTTVRDAFARQA